MDPADLRAEPIEDELRLGVQYLVYGLFERPDRPDGAFLSKRWVRLDDLLEHGGYGNLKVKIEEYEASKAARKQATIEAKFKRGWQQRRGVGGGRHVQVARGIRGRTVRTVRPVRPVTVRTVRESPGTVRNRKGQGSHLLRCVGVAAREPWRLLHELCLERVSRALVSR